MDFSIMLVLLQDGLTNGAIYALLGLSTVLVFAVTRIIFIPQGEFVSLGALTLAALQAGKSPATVWLLVGLGAAVFCTDLWRVWHDPETRSRGRALARSFVATIALPAALAFVVLRTSWAESSMAVQIALTLAIIVPTGPWLYRLAFQPLNNASVLVLLIAAVALHFSLMGLGLVMFGPEGVRTTPFVDATLDLGWLVLPAQSLAVVLLGGALMLALYFYFNRTMTGKALRATAVNAAGARLVGISPTSAGQFAFALAAGIGVVSGIMIAPLTTVYYDSGFLMGLKGFVAAVLGGLASYPITAAGAVMVGLIESFGSFFSSAYKEAIVFTLIFPVLVWRSVVTHQGKSE